LDRTAAGIWGGPGGAQKRVRMPVVSSSWLDAPEVICFLLS
jgi:hypothetical protein